MATLWQYWSIKDLQNELNRRSPGLLDSLERILPGVLGQDFLPDSLYTKESLTKVFEAFLPANVLADVEFRRTCLNRLPPDELRSFAAAIGVGSRASDFATLRDELAACKWTENFAKAFVSHFRLPGHFLPVEREKTPTHIELAPPSPEKPAVIASRFKQLKDFQYPVYSEASRRVQTPYARFVIQMPTGSGKTRTAMEVICETLNQGETFVVVWLAHSEELCEQSLECFLDVWPHVAARPLRAHRCWGSHNLPELRDDSASFIVSSFKKLHEALRKDERALSYLQARAVLLVVDEAHITEAPTHKDVIRALIGDGTRVVGLTATPGRANEMESKSLAEFYFNEKVGIPAPPGESVIAMLRNRRVLSHARYNPIITDIDIQLTPKQAEHLRNRFEFPEAIIRQLAQNDLRNLEIIRRLKEECEKGHKILLFACSLDHSKFLTSTLLYLGLRAGHLDGTTGTAHRRKLITDFKTGDLQVLCNYGVLTTGFDAPATDVVFITRPTNSPVLYSQMIGRGLRGPAIGGTPTCTIIDVRDNILGFGDAEQIYLMFDDYYVN